MNIVGREIGARERTFLRSTRSKAHKAASLVAGDGKMLLPTAKHYPLTLVVKLKEVPLLELLILHLFRHTYNSGSSHPHHYYWFIVCRYQYSSAAPDGSSIHP